MLSAAGVSFYSLYWLTTVSITLLPHRQDPVVTGHGRDHPHSSRPIIIDLARIYEN